jgi:hypothetical protein
MAPAPPSPRSERPPGRIAELGGRRQGLSGPPWRGHSGGFPGSAGGNGASLSEIHGLLSSQDGQRPFSLIEPRAGHFAERAASLPAGMARHVPLAGKRACIRPRRSLIVLFGGSEWGERRPGAMT